jgi:hypothetical protein
MAAKSVTLLKTCDPNGPIEDIELWQTFYEKRIFNSDIHYIG